MELSKVTSSLCHPQTKQQNDRQCNFVSFHKNNKFKTLIVCSDGAITEKLCPDGMVFNDYSIDQEKCDLPFNIDCSKRSKLREYLFHIDTNTRL